MKKLKRLIFLPAVADGLRPVLRHWFRLFQHLKSGRDEMALVDEVARIITATLDIDQVYERFALEMRKIVGFDLISINVVDHEAGILVRKYDFGQPMPAPFRSDIWPLHGSHTQHVIETGQTLVRANIAAHRRFTGDSDFLEAGLNSSIRTPLISKGRAIGTIGLFSKGTGAFGRRAQRVLERSASQIAPAIENAQLYEQTRIIEKEANERSEELSVLFDVASALSNPGHFLDKATSVMEQLAQVSDVEWATLRLPDQDGNLTLLVAAGSAIHTSPPMPVLSDRENLAYSAFQESRPIVANDYHAEGKPSPAVIALGMKSMVLLPIKAGDQTLGLINLVSRQTNHFTPELVKLLTAVADGIGALLENAKLSQELQANAEEMAVVDEVARIMTATLEIDQVYERFAEEVKKLVDFDRIAIALVDHDAGTYTTKHLMEDDHSGWRAGDTVPLDGSYTDKVISTRQSIARDDIATGPGFASDRSLSKLGMRSILVAPLLSQGQPIGTLILTSRRLAAFGAREKAIIERLAHQIASAVENATLFEEAQRSREQQRRLAQENRALAEIGEIINSSLDIAEVYEGFVSKANELLTFDWMNVNLLDSEGGSLTLTHLLGPDIPDRGTGTTIPLPGTFTEGIIHSESGIIAQGAEIDIVEQFPGLVPLVQADAKSFLGVPLINRNQMLGALIIVSSKPNNYSQQDLQLLRRVCNQIAGAIANVQLYEKTKQAEEAERQRSKELAALLEVASILSQPGTFEQKVGQVMEQLCEIGEADQVVFRVPESGGLRLVAAVGSEPRLPTLLPYNGSIPALAVSQRQTIVIDDYPSHPLATAHYLSRGMNSTLSAPVISQGAVLGVVTVGSLQTNHFTPDRVNLLTAIVNGLGPLLETAQLEDERNRTEERMQETAHLASIGELAAGVAHEINNPLTSVLGYSDMVLRNKLPKKYRDDLQTIYDQAKRAAKIVQNLAFFARRSDTDKQYLDVNAILNRALEMKSYDFKVNNIQVTTLFSPEIRKTMVDEHQLVQVILNLLTNAEQAIRKTRGKGHIDVCTASLGEGIQITISDDGPGIPPEHLHKIFDPFFTTKGVGHGTGLGLSISYGIVKSHGGEIWAESRAGEGATFRITLPVALPENIAIPQFSRPAPNGGSTKHLLVVDDEPDIRDLLRKYLELERYTVDLAGDGNEAWRKLRTMSYDCILLDLKMPQMSGPELYELLRDFSPSLANKVVFITGDTANPASLDFISDTGNFFITKPFRLQDLLEKVNELWERQSSGQVTEDVQTVALRP